MRELFIDHGAIGETQTALIQSKALRSPKKTRIVPASWEFEYIFVLDFTKGEFFPEIPQTQLTPIGEMCEVAPVREYKLLHLTRAGKSEQPLLVTADQLEETAKPYQDKAEPFFFLR